MIIFILLLLVIIIIILAKKHIEYFNTAHNKRILLYDQLVYIDNLFNERKIVHWLMYGTLLGAKKERDLILYDTYFTFGAHIEDAYKFLDLNKYVNYYGYYLYKYHVQLRNIHTGVEEDTWNMTINIEHNGILICTIYFFEKFNDGFMRRFYKKDGTYFNGGSDIFPIWFIEQPIKLKIRDRYFVAPRHSEMLLTYWYGINWDVPVGMVPPNSTELRDNYKIRGISSVHELIDYLTYNYGIILTNRFDNRTKYLNNVVNYVYPYKLKEYVIYT